MPGKKVAGKCIDFNGHHMKHVIVDMEMNSNLIIWTKCTAEISSSTYSLEAHVTLNIIRKFGLL